MTQTTGRFFDELGKLITDTAGAAQGVRKEIESVVRAQAENILRELDPPLGPFGATDIDRRLAVGSNGEFRRILFTPSGC